MIRDSFLRKPVQFNSPHSLFGIIASGISGHLAPLITHLTSMYEGFQDLTSVQSQHFVEWFSGSAVDSIWTAKTWATGGTLSMADEVDGGLDILSSSPTGKSGITFGDKRQYAHDGSAYIMVSKLTGQANNYAYMGMGDGSDMAGGAGIDGYGYTMPVSGNFTTWSGDNSSWSNTSGSIASDTSFHVFYGIVDGTDIKTYIDGVLDVTKTTNRPTVKLQPCCEHRKTTTTSNSIRIRYLEAYNTAVPITSSLYERLSPLTQVAGQRVVENFSGSAIQSQRWTFADLAGTNAGAMADEVDGGYRITTANTASARAVIRFNAKRQYSETGSVCISNIRRNEADSQTWTGFAAGNGDLGSSIANYAAAYDYGGNTYKVIRTSDGTSASETNSTVTVNTALTNYKVEMGSTPDAKLYINGILEVTKTTNMPNAKVEPVFGVYRRSGAAAVSGDIIYYEAYNKLATETSFPSVYELFNPLTTVNKSHFWDWFSGSALSSIWTAVEVVGSGGVVSMEDSVDGGLSILAGSSGTNPTVQLTFSDKRHYAHDGSICIWTMKAVATNFYAMGGFNGVSAQSPILANQNYSFIGTDTGGNFHIRVAKSTGNGSTDFGVAADTNWHTFKIDLNNSAQNLGYMDGVLKATQTTNIPDGKLQPFLSARKTSGELLVRYYEAYNT